MRFSSANHTRTRSFAFFLASGQPTKRSLDTGGWSSSEAQLEPAEPPPRRPVVSTAAPPRTQRPGPALASQSSWGGPRPMAPPPSANFAAPPAPMRRSAASPASADNRVPQRRPDRQAEHLRQAGGASVEQHVRLADPEEEVHWPPLPAASSRQQRRRAAGVVGDDDRLDQVLAQLALLNKQNAAMAEDMRELRRENAALRRQLDEARGIRVHQPYSQPPPLPSPRQSPPQPPAASPWTPMPGCPHRNHLRCALPSPVMKQQWRPTPPRPQQPLSRSV